MDSVTDVIAHVGDLMSLNGIPMDVTSVRGLTVRWMESVDLREFDGTYQLFSLCIMHLTIP